MKPQEFKDQLFVVYDYNGGLSRSGGTPVRLPMPTVITAGVDFA